METTTTATPSEISSTASVPATSSAEAAPSSTSDISGTAGATSAASTTAPSSEGSGSIEDMDAGQWLGVIALGAVPIIGPVLQVMEIADPGSILGNKGASQTAPTSTEPVTTESVATEPTTAPVEASSAATSTVDASASVPTVSGVTAEGAEFMAA